MTCAIVRFAIRRQSDSSDRVALWAHGDDQAEMILLRMLRGGRFTGLAGMPHIRERLFVRPLLGAGGDSGLPWWRGGVVLSGGFQQCPRSRYAQSVRHEVVPILESLAPAATGRSHVRAMQLSR